MLFSGNLAGAQENELDKRSGFKEIKLGQSIDSIQGVKLKKEFKEDGNVNISKLYEIEHPNYSMIGEIKVMKIEAKTYRDLIYEIRVFTEKDPRLMKALESVYGLATYDAKNIRYFWKSDKMILTYESKSKRELLLEYKSFTVPKLMSEDKEKKIENIADDF
jgi:hypothetical protein